MVCKGVVLNACLFPGCITFRNQEAIPCTVTQVPPWQRWWWGHIHENCQSLCCVSVSSSLLKPNGIFLHMSHQIIQFVATYSSTSLPFSTVWPMNSPDRTGKYTATRTGQEVSEAALSPTTCRCFCSCWHDVCALCWWVSFLKSQICSTLEKETLSELNVTHTFLLWLFIMCDHWHQHVRTHFAASYKLIAWFEL